MADTREVRKRFFGDTFAAQHYTKNAMNLLSYVKDQMAYMKLGQLSQHVNLPNGIGIFAASIFGQDEIRIYAPVQKSSEVPSEPGKLPKPYMWVGIRIKLSEGIWGGRVPSLPPASILALMAEPEVIAGDGAPPFKRGLVMSSGATSAWSRDVRADLDNPAEPPPLPTLDKTLEVAVNDFHDYWDYLPETGLPAGVHNLQFKDTSPKADSLFTFSINGLRCFDSANKSWYSEEEIPREQTFAFAPYDPQLPSDEQDGVGDTKRDFNDAVYADYYNDRRLGRYAWDVVYVLDPGEASGTFPSDPRPRVNLARQVLEGNGMAAGDAMVLPGEYVLCLGAYGDNNYISNRAGRKPIAGLDPGYFWTIDAADAWNYLNRPYDPLVLEVEVRLGKAPDTKTYKYEVTIRDYGIGSQVTLPYGDHSQGFVCPGSAGANPHSKNWAKSSLYINVAGRSCEVRPDVPAGIFTPGTPTMEWVPDFQSPLLYIYLGVGIDFLEGMDAKETIARMILDFQDQMSTGYWGYRKLYWDFTYGKILDALYKCDPLIGEPGQKFDILLWDPSIPDEAHNVNITPIRGLPRNDYVGGEGEIPESLRWWWQYALDTKAGCKTPYWMITVGNPPSAGTGEFQLYGEPPPGYNCCPIPETE